jgi:hypothetical protein
MKLGQRFIMVLAMGGWEEVRGVVGVVLSPIASCFGWGRSSRSDELEDGQSGVENIRVYGLREGESGPVMVGGDVLRGEVYRVPEGEVGVFSV